MVLNGNVEERTAQLDGASASFVPIYRVTLMSWCFQFLLDLLWIPLAAYFKDLGFSLHLLGVVFALNLGVRIVPNIFATRVGVRSDLFCMSCGLVCFTFNFIWPGATWAIFLMSAGGGMTFVRAHLSVHGKLAAGGSKERLTLASKWCGAARNAGTVVAFSVPTLLYERFGWASVVAMAIVVTVLYLVLASIQHLSYREQDGAGSMAGEAVAAGLVEQAPAETIPWIDWVMAGAFCVTELQMNVQAAAVPTVLMSSFSLPMPVVGIVQAVGQVVAMSFLMLLSKGFCSVLQKRPMNLVLAFFSTFVALSIIWAVTALRVNQVSVAVLGLFFFYISAYTAQVTMLECLMGVLDLQNSIVVMGVAEMFGCGCSLVGGYLGPALLAVDPSAPFALQMAVAAVTTAVLALCLGHRAMTQLVVCETEAQYDASLQSMIKKRPSLLKSLQGLKQMSKRPESYIGVEQLYRKHSSASLATVASTGSLCVDVETPPAVPPTLQEALLPTPVPTPRAGGHVRCSSEVVPMVDTAASTYEARQVKKALVSFDLAYVDLDTQDYAVDPADAKHFVITHQKREV